MALVLLMKSQRIIQRKRVIPAAASAMQPYIDQLWRPYYEIFTASNKQSR